MKSPSAASFGHSHDHNRLAPCGRSGSSTLSVATSSTSRTTGSVAIRTHLLLQALGDAARHDGQLGRVQAPGSRQVDLELLSDSAWPAREHQDAIAKPDRLA